MAKKKVIIVHGWNSAPDDCWFPWLRSTLEKDGVRVSVPALPDPKNPNIEKWVSLVQKEAGTSGGDTYFVGHSLGAYIILSIIERLPENTTIGGALLIAGRTHLRDKSKINVEKVRAKNCFIYGIFSDDDYYVDVAESRYFEEYLGAKTTILHNRGHFSRVEGAKEVPEILIALKDMLGKN